MEILTIVGKLNKLEGIIQNEGSGDLLITSPSNSHYLPELVMKIAKKLDGWSLLPSGVITGDEAILASEDGVEDPYRQELNSLFGEVRTFAIEFNNLPGGEKDITVACTRNTKDAEVWGVIEEEAEKMGIDINYFMCPSSSCNTSFEAHKFAERNKADSNYLSLYLSDSFLSEGADISQITELIGNVRKRWEKGNLNRNTKSLCRFPETEIKAIEKKTKSMGGFGAELKESHKIMDSNDNVYNVLDVNLSNRGGRLAIFGKGDTTLRRTFYPDGGICYVKMPIGDYENSITPTGIPRVEDAFIICGEKGDKNPKKMRRVIKRSKEPYEVIKLEEFMEFI